MNSRQGWTAAAVVAGLCIAVAAQDAAPRQQPAATQPAAANRPAAAPPAEDVMREMRQEIESNPLIAPLDPRAESRPRAARPGQRVNLDPAVVGVAPGGQQPRLRREGEFVVNRRGRLVKSPSGAHTLFAFEADAQQSPEPPMILLPCLVLQNMEDLVQERGDRITFLLSGQVFEYRGANYLLPTMMRPDIDRGNLQR